MARVFVRATGNYLETTTFPSVALPFTVVYWFYATDVTNIHYGWSASANIAGNVSYFFLGPRGDVSGDPIHAIADNEPSGTGIAATSSGYSANTWHHAAGVFSSSTSRSVYLDGGSKVTNTTSASPDSINTMNVGAFYYTNTRFAGFGGRIAYLAMWNVALSDDEIADLGRKLNGVPCGVHPIRIRPESLVACYPLGGFHGEHDGDIWKDSYNLTPSGTPTWEESPAVIYPSRKKIIFPASSPAPPSSTKYSWWAWNTFGTPLDHGARS